MVGGTEKLKGNERDPPAAPSRNYLPPQGFQFRPNDMAKTRVLPGAPPGCAEASSVSVGERIEPPFRGETLALRTTHPPIVKALIII
jgi:hypothetical protein